ncbi:beta-lactamase family protein [Bacteriovoracaceae bacterium]|nr:beta-lactamase family protein [Bacteriovoracaceae bacterium]
MKSFFLLFFLCGFTFTQDLIEIRDKYKVPSLAAAFIKDGREFKEVVGLRSISHNILAANNDKWHFGSNGKSMTATLVAILVERGIVDWKKNLSNYLPHYQLHSDFKKLTLRELLAHRSGMTGEMKNYSNGKLREIYEDETKSPQIKRKLMAKLILSQRATNSKDTLAYSNFGYVTVAVILNEITGQSWEKLIQTYLFNPLGLKTCGFGAAGKSDHKSPIQPWPHYLYEKKVYSLPPNNKYSDNFPVLAPSGSIHCSLSDWMNYAQLHLDGLNQKDTKILKRRSFKYLHSDYKNQNYTSGGFIFEKRNGNIYLGHNGSNRLNYSLFVLDAENNSAFVAVTNIDGGRGDKAAKAAMKSIGSPDVCMKNGFCLLSE